MMEATHIIKPEGAKFLETHESSLGVWVSCYGLVNSSSQPFTTEDRAIAAWNKQFSKAPRTIEYIKPEGSKEL